MATVIDICNAALAKLGAESIREFDKANKRSRVCEIMYPHARDTLLGQYDWSFARRIVALREALDATTVPELGKAYIIPQDCVRPLDVYPRGSADAWEVIGGFIYTRTAAPRLRYTRREANAGVYTTSFVDALAAKLAFEISPTILAATDNDRAGDRLQNRAQAALLYAQEEDASRGSEYLHPDKIMEQDSFVDPDAALAARMGLNHDSGLGF
jgi:hypothetical protein